MKRGRSSLFGLVMLAIVGTCYGSWYVWKRSTVRSWPTVEGSVVISEVHSWQKTRKGRTQTHYGAKIVYRYEVNGTPYQSDRVGLTSSGGSTSRGTAEAQVAASPVGSQVKVHYNPDDPSEGYTGVD